MGNKICKKKGAKTEQESIPFQRIKYDMDPIFSKSLPIYWIIGPRASGKTTQANLLADFVGGAVISIRKIVEDAGERENERGNFINQHYKKHVDIPDELVIDILKEQMLQTIKEKPDVKALIIDGFPADVNEANLFSKEVYKPFVIIILNTKFPVIMERLAACNPDVTGAWIQEHLPQYRLGLKSIRALYDNKMERIEANGPPEEVFKHILELLQERFRMETADGAFMEGQMPIGQ